MVPTTVSNFLRSVESGAYTGTLIHKVFPGQYIMAGQQGTKRFGRVMPPENLAPNTDVTSSKVRNYQYQCCARCEETDFLP